MLFRSGLELALCTLEDRDPAYRDTPDVYLETLPAAGLVLGDPEPGQHVDPPPRPDEPK